MQPERNLLQGLQNSLRPAAGFCRLWPKDDQNRRLARVVGQLGQAVSPYTLRKYGARRTLMVRVCADPQDRESERLIRDNPFPPWALRLAGSSFPLAKHIEGRRNREECWQNCEENCDGREAEGYAMEQFRRTC